MPVVEIRNPSQKAPPTNEGLAHPTLYNRSAFEVLARVALGLIGGLNDLIEREPVRKLVRAVDTKDGNSLNDYLSGRSLSFAFLHPCIQEHALGILTGRYEAAVCQIKKRIETKTELMRSQL
jgi:hypothetical protein